ncbi:hypothetical protein K0504_04855 [Neiella marina]|uniref:Uncharacterized protein n=1 Tax=Neiella holothuriorum TaxID=2870530 RepID=A0ABS7EEK3_9GAMM|nr:hypothetical protein [Neiella holothuriorum]MBW8190358.1 hypothetical protein [Neiella holothuriorum]
MNKAVNFGKHSMAIAVISAIILSVVAAPSYAISYTFSHESQERFMKNNPRAAHTITNPHLASRCIAGVTVFSKISPAHDRFADDMKEVMWAFVEDYNPRPNQTDKLSKKYAAPMAKSDDNFYKDWNAADCTNLFDSLMLVYLKDDEPKE